MSGNIDIDEDFGVDTEVIVPVQPALERSNSTFSSTSSISSFDDPSEDKKSAGKLKNEKQRPKSVEAFLKLLKQIDSLVGYYVNPAYPKSLVQIFTHALSGGARAGLLTHLIIVGFALARRSTRKPIGANQKFDYSRLFLGWKETTMGRSVMVYAFTWKFLYWMLEYIARLRDNGYGKLQSLMPSPANSPLIQAARNGFSKSLQQLNMARKSSIKYLSHIGTRSREPSNLNVDYSDNDADIEDSSGIEIKLESPAEDPGEIDPLTSLVLEGPAKSIDSDTSVSIAAKRKKLNDLNKSSHLDSSDSENNSDSKKPGAFLAFKERMVSSLPIGSITQSIQRTSIWRLVWPTHPHRTEIPKPSRIHATIAGSIAGFLAIRVHPEKSRAPLVEHLSVRALQALLNGGRCARFISKFTGDKNGPWGLGWGAPLFMLGSMFVMYGYVMEPTSLPREYYSWMVKAANVSAKSLDLVRKQVRLHEVGKSVTKPQISTTMSQVKMIDVNQFSVWKKYYEMKGHINAVPCEFFHPHHAQCTQYYLQELIPHIIRMCGPVYLALNVVPSLVLKPKQIIKSPAKFIRKSAVSTFRSTLFICLYITIYQSIICLQRRQDVVPDYKGIYMIAGAVCAVPILLEHDRRRLELALYVLPKAFGVFLGSVRRRGMKIPYTSEVQVLIMSVSMGIIMNFYHADRSRLSGLLVSIMTKIIGTH